MKDFDWTMSKVKTIRRMVVFITIISVLIVVKVVWVKCAISGYGSFETERKDIIRRANYLISRLPLHHRSCWTKCQVVLGNNFRENGLSIRAL